MLIPQSMAYAQLAGLPPYYGLYASLLPPVVAALFGSSRQLATGPVAIVSLMTAAALEPIATAGSEMYIAYAIMLALFVGIFQLCLGALRLGALVNFVSHPVVIGLTNAAAIIIAVSQLSKFFGVSIEKADNLFQTVALIAQAAYQDIHLPTLLLGLAAFVIMFGLKKLSPKIPYVLAAVVITAVISWAVGFEDIRTVSIDQIDSDDARSEIEQYGKTLRAISEMTEVRAAFMPEIQSIVAARPATCQSCHNNRDIDFFAASSAESAGRGDMDLEKERISIRALHAMAGLVNDRIQEVKPAGFRAPGENPSASLRGRGCRRRPALSLCSRKRRSKSLRLFVANDPPADIAQSGESSLLQRRTRGGRHTERTAASFGSSLGQQRSGQSDHRRDPDIRYRIHGGHLHRQSHRSSHRSSGWTPTKSSSGRGWPTSQERSPTATRCRGLSPGRRSTPSQARYQASPVSLPEPPYYWCCSFSPPCSTTFPSRCSPPSS